MFLIVDLLLLVVAIYFGPLLFVMMLPILVFVFWVLVVMLIFILYGSFLGEIGSLGIG